MLCRMAVAGIYFGNTNSVISVCMNGRVETVSNETGFRYTPTVVAYTGSEKVVGQPAKQYMLRNPLSCITNIKPCIGQSFTDEHINEMQKTSSCKVLSDNGNIQYEVKVDEKSVLVSAVDAASYIFTKLLEIAELVGGEDLEDVVLAVPLDFSDEQILALREAAENVGCNVLRVISEPAAALLAYDISQNDANVESTCLVFRLGASSMDSAIMQSRSGMYRVVGQKLDREFGGNNFDEALIKYMTDEFKRSYKEDISNNKKAIGKLKTAIADCKHGLSQIESNMCAVESLYDGLDFRKQLHRAKFESVCGELFSRCMTLVTHTLESCGMMHTDIDKVILIGGGVRMPRLVKLFKDRFTQSDLLNHILPDEAISNGAALQAALLSGREDVSISTSSTHLDCTSRNIGIKIIKDNKASLQVVVPQYSPLPSRKIKTFDGTANQSSVCLWLYEYDEPILEKANLLGKIALRDLPMGDKEKKFLLTIELNRAGELTVSLREELSDRIEKLTIENSS